ncbi:putative porin [Acinetobacter baumannii]|uniref:putative porin n=1 Tax=Acinetobacter baumannii TaxID=470 RepID=UPI00028DA7A5|nr:putative porin [Acinetobacter baumannii]EHU1439934.1 putative porin [Acinetobacter baumannii]EHU1614601.1 putative porin [Acinetobacter baumannii]EHU1702861.1 putative porin [Acinetobacter baumannii]EHU1807771.1 putative porin [Acinetobacter baumannii]EHU2311681.1 putative porin [Acinetobacter baumannii]
MKKSKFLFAIFTAVSAFNANAYQTEVGTMYEFTDMDGGEVNSFGINGKYYFNPVETKNYPLAEAAFLNKASNIGAGYTYSKVEDDQDYAKLEYNSVGIVGEYFVPNTPLYLSGAFNRTKREVTVDDLGSVNDNGNGYAVEVGFLPTDDLLLAAGVTDLSESFDPVQASKYGFITSFANATTVTGEDDDTAVTLRAKYITQISGFYTNFEGQTYIGDETTYRLGADLYLDPTLSIGASFADSTAEDSDTIFSLRAQKFFTPQVAVGLTYTTVDDANSFGINGTFRF